MRSCKTLQHLLRTTRDAIKVVVWSLRQCLKQALDNSILMIVQDMGKFSSLCKSFSPTIGFDSWLIMEQSLHSMRDHVTIPVNSAQGVSHPLLIQRRIWQQETTRRKPHCHWLSVTNKTMNFLLANKPRASGCLRKDVCRIESFNTIRWCCEWYCWNQF